MLIINKIQSVLRFHRVKPLPIDILGILNAFHDVGDADGLLPDHD